MTFSEAEKTDIRRFCGYGSYGATSTVNTGYRYFTNYGLLEYRMNNLQTSEEAVVRDKFLVNLIKLEEDLLLTAGNLDTSKAAVWTHNKNEQADRENLFTSFRVRRAQFFRIPFGESGSGNIRIVV